MSLAFYRLPSRSCDFYRDYFSDTCFCPLINVAVLGYNDPITGAAVVNPSTIQNDNHDGRYFTADTNTMITAMLTETR